MNHTEQRIYLIKELQKVPSQLSSIEIPEEEQLQKDLLRGLMNIWEPVELSDEFYAIQDEYLKEEIRREGITDIDDLKEIEKNIYLYKGDMTQLKVDAIVNPANSGLTGCWSILHNCADNYVHSKAGLKLRYTCNEIMAKQGHPEPTGRAKITPGYNLPCRYVIHTVGPIVNGPLDNRHKELLKSSYKSCLDIAFENNLDSIAFCCISTGVFMFPNDIAAKIAVDTVHEFYRETGSNMKVVFDVFKDLDYDIYSELLKQ